MLVSESDQVTRRKFSQRETKLSPPTMFTRSQAAANTTTAAKTVTSSSQSFTTASVVSGGGSITTDSSNSSSSDAVPSVSLTITAVAANIPERDGCITTITAPALDTPTITNLVLNSLEGVHSGVPTRTTPTLTPTTLRNIEQTFLELSSVQPPETHTNQAGFVPPLVQPATGNTYVSVDSRCWGGGTLTQIPHTSSSSSSSSGGVHLRAPTAHTATSTAATLTAATLTMPSQIQQQHQRRTGGRRPIKDERITAEEEERRSLRRERNKLAAARCRKRRLDQTNMLQDETDELEDKKSELQTEIQLLQQQRDELEFLLATHKAVCRRHVQAGPAPVVTSAAPISVSPVTVTATVTNTSLRPARKQSVVVKEEPMEDEEEAVKVETNVVINNTRPRRPTSLNVAPVALRTPSVADLGVSIETPSTGLRGFNFDSMMEGGTGLTPVTSGTGLTPLHTGLTPLSTPVVSAPSASASSNCSTQQRSSSSDLSSPDSVPPKLVSL